MKEKLFALALSIFAGFVLYETILIALNEPNIVDIVASNIRRSL